MTRKDVLGNIDESVTPDYNWNFDNPNGYYFVVCSPIKGLELPWTNGSGTTIVDRGTKIISIQNYGAQYEREATLEDGRTVRIRIDQYIYYPPAVPIEVFGKEEMMLGSNSIYVKAVQVCLNSLGFSLDIDGVFGEDTQKAVVGYRKKYLNEKNPPKTVGPTAKKDLFTRFYGFIDWLKQTAYESFKKMLE